MYNYKKELPRLLTDQGQRNLIKTLDHVRKILEVSGAITMEQARLRNGNDSYESMAYVDRLVEIGIIREIAQQGKIAGEDRIFVLVEER